jgi:hypothetical protein
LQVALDLAQRAQHACAVEALSLTVVAVTHVGASLAIGGRTPSSSHATAS